MSKQIFAAEVILENLSVRLKEKYFNQTSVLTTTLTELNTEFEEVFILATPTRWSLYVVSDSILPLQAFIGKQPETKAHTQIYYNTQESVTHLFAVSSGLLSNVKGDPEILNRLKSAFELAEKAGTIGLYLTNLLREAIAVGHKIRTHTGIDKYCASVADVAFSLLYDRLTNFFDKKILIIGSGKMARTALNHFKKEGVAKIGISTEEQLRGKYLAERYQVKNLSFDKIADHIIEADIVMVCPNVVLHLGAKDLSEIGVRNMLKVDGVKKIVIDFGIPANFENKTGQATSIELFNIDDLKAMQKTPLDDFGGLDDAWKLVMVESKIFLDIHRQFQSSSILSNYWSELIRFDRVSSVKKVPDNSNISNREAEAVRQYSRKKVVRKKTSWKPQDMALLTNNLQSQDAMKVVRHIKSFKVIRVNVSPN
jgi:glutamyl-tRNA reductase